MSLSVTILGCNSALPTSKRFSTAQVLEVSGRFFLIDCGEGTQIQLRRFKLNFAKLNHIFISHLHGDHYFGIWGILSTFSLLNRKTPLHIFGHANLKKLIDFHITTGQEFIGYEIVFHPLQYDSKSIIFEDEALIVESFPLKHRIPVCGFLFREKPKPRNIKKEMVQYLQIPYKEIHKIKEGQDYITEAGEIFKNEFLTNPPPPSASYAFCTDTKPFEKLAGFIGPVDLLYHEATYTSELEKQAHETGHSTALDAAKSALKAKVKTLLLGHYSSRYKDLKPLLAEAQSLFPNTELAEDGKVFIVK